MPDVIAILPRQHYSTHWSDVMGFPALTGPPSLRHLSHVMCFLCAFWFRFLNAVVSHSMRYYCFFITIALKRPNVMFYVIRACCSSFFDSFVTRFMCPRVFWFLLFNACVRC